MAKDPEAVTVAVMAKDLEENPDSHANHAPKVKKDRINLVRDAHVKRVTTPEAVLEERDVEAVLAAVEVLMKEKIMPSLSLLSLSPLSLSLLLKRKSEINDKKISLVSTDWRPKSLFTKAITIIYVPLYHLGYCKACSDSKKASISNLKG